MKDLVSIIIPCYNNEKYIEETVDSCLIQSYTNIELILVNDGSIDDSKNIIDKLSREYKNIRCLHLENGGASRARNKGIEIAHGKYILPLDGDDLLEKTYIEKLIAEFDKDNELVLVTGQGRFFGEVNEDWTLPPYSLKKILHGNIIFISSMFKKSDWKKINGFDETLKLREDWDFFIRLTREKPNKVKRINHIGLLYRIRKTSKSSKINKIKTRQETYFHIYENNKNLYFEYYDDPISLIKEVETLKWENEKKQRELNYLNKWLPVKIINYIRKIKNGK